VWPGRTSKLGLNDSLQQEVQKAAGASGLREGGEAAGFGPAGCVRSGSAFGRRRRFDWHTAEVQAATTRLAGLDVEDWTAGRCQPGCPALARR